MLANLNDGSHRAPISGVSRDDVQACFEAVLGRTPDPELIDYHFGLGFIDRAALGAYLRTTSEFTALYYGVRFHPSDLADEWKNRAIMASARAAKLKSFGDRARGVVVEADTGWYVVDPEDGSVSASLLGNGDYAPDELRNALALVPEQGQVLVVGTHIGSLAIPLSGRCARLDAVEANPRTQKLLSLNVKLNGRTNIVIHPFAAGSKPETLQFLLSRDNSGGSKRKPLSGEHYYYDDPEIVEVKAFPLDEAIGVRAYDLILMDCEGSEYFALQGMHGILAQANILSIEFLKHHLVNVGGATIDQFADQVEPFFDWLYVPTDRRLIGKPEMRAVLHDMFDRDEGHDAIYFAKRPPDAWGRP